MRTIIEMKPEHRARALEQAAHRGKKGFSTVVAEALELYLETQPGRANAIQGALALKGSMSETEAAELLTQARVLRANWRSRIADTDVLIDYLAGKGKAGAVERLFGGGALRTTVISWFELISGEAVPSSALADAASEIRRSLERVGHPIGMADSLIAGIVVSNGGTLLTRNRRHFERVPA